MWGDGQSSDDVPSSGNGPNHVISGVHKYSMTGSFRISTWETITYTDSAGKSYSTGTGDAADIVVSDADIQVTSTSPVSTTAGGRFTGQVASYYHPNSPSPNNNDSAEIDWGDGNTSPGTISVDAAGNYVVSGTNTYDLGGTYPITVTVYAGGGIANVTGGDPNRLSIDDTATVADAGTLSYSPPGANKPPYIAYPYLFLGADTPFDGKIGTFYDSDLNATGSNFAIDVDFGDGEDANGYVVPDGYGDGGWNVYADHDYVTAGNYFGGYTVSEAGGATLSSHFTANVSPNAQATTGTSPTIKLTSLGLDSTDPNAPNIPEVVQGMKYTVGQRFSLPAPATAADGTTTTYQFAGLTYTYPGAVPKGYGHFTTKPGGTLKFTGDPNTLPQDSSTVATQVQALPIPSNEQIFTIFSGGNPQFTDTFYWGPANQGVQPISVDAVFNVLSNGKPTGQAVHATDSVEVNVLRPTGSIVATMGQPGFQTVNETQNPKYNPDRVPSIGLDQNSVYGPRPCGQYLGDLRRPGYRKRIMIDAT